MAKKVEKEITIESFLEDMNKKFGDNAISEFGDGIAPVEVIPTGLPSFDYATGVGGLARGRIVEIYGAEGAGKTTIAIKVMAQAQQLAGQMPRLTYTPAEGQEIKPLTGRVGFIDVEHAFSPSLAKLHGLNMDKGSGFYFSQPTGGEEALQMLEYMVCSNLFDVIVLDSVAGLTSLDEQENEIGKKVMAGTAQLMSSGLKKLVPLINKSRTVVIFINQVREKVAVLYGNPETTTGGRALKFYASTRIRVSKKESIMEGTTQVGHRVGMDIKKNKVAPPFQKAEIDLLYRESKGRPQGFDILADLLKVAQLTGVVQLRGSSYQYIDKETGEIHKAVGQVKWNAYLNEHPEVLEAILDEVMGGEQNESSNDK